MTTPEPQWWAGIYDDDGEQRPHTDYTEYDPDPHRPWWQVRRGVLPPLPDAPREAPPTVQVTINQPAPRVRSRAEDRRAARMRWCLVHAAAAGVGYGLGLVGLVATAMTTADGGALAMGTGFCLIAAIPAVYLPGLPWIPPPLRPMTMWLARIPVASAVLAVLLYAPGGTR
ncbi:hypothetical protein AB0M28_13555 [Streptomyces sp. NPDC051940]|uniref:hypothetical protein n=1 Tax=Streptomyces sp. NPDC051940 TaxID=3155675 RepID=UPI003433484C